MAATSVVVTDYRAQIPGELRDDEWVFPTVWSSARTGKRMYWTIRVRPLDDNTGKFAPFPLTYLDNGVLPQGIAGWYKVDAGYEGGAVRKSDPTIVRAGKNAGKSNATNAVCQALRDALSLYAKQLRKSAVPTDGNCALIPPMLAEVYDEKKHAKIFPVYVQRKYNGIRTVACLCDDEVVLYSRTSIRLPGYDYLRADIIGMMRAAAAAGTPVYLDGELYKHGVPLQVISGNGRRSNTVVADYNYMVYDIICPTNEAMPYVERHALLSRLFAESACAWAQLVETVECADVAELDAIYRRYLKEGFEGAMIRIPGDRYVPSLKGYHTSSLLKLKPTLDAEFRVIRWDTGKKGKAADALMIVCVTDKGREFAVTPAMEIADRVDLARRMPMVEDNGKTYFENVWKDRMITVQYAELSVDGVPTQPRTRMMTRVDEPTSAAALVDYPDD